MHDVTTKIITYNKNITYEDIIEGKEKIMHTYMDNLLI
jgi:hypothetical protein